MVKQEVYYQSGVLGGLVSEYSLQKCTVRVVYLAVNYQSCVYDGVASEYISRGLLSEL